MQKKQQSNYIMNQKPKKFIKINIKLFIKIIIKPYLITLKSC